SPKTLGEGEARRGFSMQVKIDKTFQVKEPLEKVWKFLSDPKTVVTCVPGAKITEAIDERTFKGAISIKVGPVVTNYHGEVKIERLDEANHELELVGKGLDEKGKGSASMKMTGRLRKLEDGGTEVIGSSEVSVTGRLAQLGSRMIVEVSNQMFEQFNQKLKESLQSSERLEVENEAPKPVQAVPLLLSTIWMMVVRFFQRITGRSAES
ncbi:MAG: SRPBCC family protein, partial [Nitrospira sp.]|nr:SRPBCC family protein [Nitrospira sp.]